MISNIDSCFPFALKGALHSFGLYFGGVVTGGGSDRALLGGKKLSASCVFSLTGNGGIDDMIPGIEVILQMEKILSNGRSENHGRGRDTVTARRTELAVSSNA